jgi:hypothetical protein
MALIQAQVRRCLPYGQNYEQSSTKTDGNRPANLHIHKSLQAILEDELIVIHCKKIPSSPAGTIVNVHQMYQMQETCRMKNTIHKLLQQTMETSISKPDKPAADHRTSAEQHRQQHRSSDGKPCPFVNSLV